MFIDLHFREKISLKALTPLIETANSYLEHSKVRILSMTLVPPKAKYPEHFVSYLASMPQLSIKEFTDRFGSVEDGGFKIKKKKATGKGTFRAVEVDLEDDKVGYIVPLFIQEGANLVPTLAFGINSTVNPLNFLEAISKKMIRKRRNIKIRAVSLYQDDFSIDVAEHAQACTECGKIVEYDVITKEPLTRSHMCIAHTLLTNFTEEQDSASLPELTTAK